jgi:hypothetical protein
LSHPTAVELPSDLAERLEQQMDDLGLSGDMRRFLRHLHAAEKQLNDAFALAQEGGDRERCVSHVYGQLYGRQPLATRR